MVHSQTDDLIHQWEGVIEEAERVCAGISSEGIWWQPAPGSWSVGEVVDHLKITTELAIPLLEKAIDDGRRKGMLQSGRFHRSRMWRWLTDKMEPPVRTRKKAPAKFRPVKGRTREASPLPGFVAVQHRLLEVVKGTAGLDLGRVRTASPLARVVTASVYDYLSFLAAHGRRHTWQAKQITKTRGFPG